MYLYWVTTDDHAEDWFIIANTAEEATLFHENVEGYDYGDATAEMIVPIPEGTATEVGWPSDEVLKACGANIISNDLERVIEIEGRKFSEGLMESTIRTLDDDMFEEIGEGRPNKTERGSVH